jgi:hypothetical protein
LRHPDASVRREAIRFLLKHDATRDAGTMLGLRVADLHLAGTMRSCAPVRSGRPPAHASPRRPGHRLRSRMARAIASVRTPETLDWLVRRS